jgi:hypothetical protein
VLETDYDSYAVVYNCFPIPSSNRIRENLWVLSRTNYIDDEEIEDRVKDLIDEYFDEDSLWLTQQGEMYVLFFRDKS